MLYQHLFRENIGYNIFPKQLHQYFLKMFPHFVKKFQHFPSSSCTSGGRRWRHAKLRPNPKQRAAARRVVGTADRSGVRRTDSAPGGVWEVGQPWQAHAKQECARGRVTTGGRRREQERERGCDTRV
jgi:hypothetical protein